MTAVDDPTDLVEVVSPGSEERDRNEKRELYKRLPSLVTAQVPYSHVGRDPFSRLREKVAFASAKVG